MYFVIIKMCIVFKYDSNIVQTPVLSVPVPNITGSFPSITFMKYCFELNIIHWFATNNTHCIFLNYIYNFFIINVNYMFYLCTAIMLLICNLTLYSF